MTDTQFNYHVFLSHNKAQKDWTRRLAQFLRNEGLQVFFDEDSIQLGEDLIFAIENGLRKSRHVLLVLSPEALASSWVALEFSASLHRDPKAAQRSIIPILRKECEIPLVLARLNYLDATSDDFDRQANQLLKAIDKDAVIPHPSEKTLIPISPVTSKKPEIGYPGGTLRPDASIYVERKSDKVLQNALQKSGQVVVVWGPRQIGKSSSVLHAINQVRKLGISTSFIDFTGIGGENLAQLTYGMSFQIAKQTGAVMPPAEEFLSSGFGHLKAFGTLLSSIRTPTVIVFDEIDYLQRINGLGDFFRFIRAFHGNQIIEQTPISFVISSFLSPREFITDIMTSPFNIGTQIKLSNFNRDEVNQLFATCQINLSSQDFDTLYNFIGGQPYLTHQVACLLLEKISPKEILLNAMSPNSFFDTHLNIIRSYVEYSKPAKQSLRKFVSNKKVTEHEVVSLIDRGILDLHDSSIVFSSKLYENYFRRICKSG
jgi:hypothetical protein